MKKLFLLMMGMLAWGQIALAQSVNSFNILDQGPVMAVTSGDIKNVPGCYDGKDVLIVGGTLSCSVGVPVLSSCGSGPSIVGTDYEGKIVVGTGILTTCSIAFSRSFVASPRCLLTSSIGSVWLSASTALGITIASSSLGGAVIYYKCWW